MRLASLMTRIFDRWRSRRSHGRLAAVTPEVIDLLAVALGSGGTVLQALRLVEARGPEPVREPVKDFNDRLRAGTPLASALLDLADKLGAPYRGTIAALVGTERDGAPISLLLARLGDEARATRRRQTEVQARRLPVKLLFPLVVCSLPAVLIGAVIPLIVLSIERL